MKYELHLASMRITVDTDISLLVIRVNSKRNALPSPVPHCVFLQVLFVDAVFLLAQSAMVWLQQLWLMVVLQFKH